MRFSERLELARSGAIRAEVQRGYPRTNTNKTRVLLTVGRGPYPRPTEQNKVVLLGSGALFGAALRGRGGGAPPGPCLAGPGSVRRGGPAPPRPLPPLPLGPLGSAARSVRLRARGWRLRRWS